jgi:hypothetical protein
LSVIAEQVAVLEEDLEQLYDDQFIETCAAWVVPYIGDLIGHRALHGVAPKVGSSRAEVAHTIGFRRRKGTAAMLEQLARDVTGWHARVVEFFQLLATTQYMNHIRPTHWYAPDLRQWEPLERLHTPFERVAHTVDVRRIANGRGLYNIPNIGIFLWRLIAYSLTDSPAFTLDDQRYLFSPLGNNTPLFTRPQTEDDITHLAEPLNVPQPISRRVLDAYLEQYYGKQQSLFLRRADGLDIAVGEVEVCDLSDVGGGNWAHQPPAGKIAIDPILGRIAFGSAQTAPPLVTFYYGFSADLGGGEYEREASFVALLPPVQEVTAPVRVEHKQTGCVRFSFVPAESYTPRRYRCQPDLEIAAQIAQAEKQAVAPLSLLQRDALRTAVLAWLAPSFSALRYGLPAYAQLRLGGPIQIRTGADDEGEMGAFHKLYQPQRETKVRVRLEEYLRFGLEAGIFYVT